MKAPTVITVASTAKDTYGSLVVTDTLGGVTKIGNKREHLFSLFGPGRAVKLTWDNYKGKDYVSDAELFDGNPPVENQKEPITAGAVPVRVEPKVAEGKNRAFALSYAKDWAIALLQSGKKDLSGTSIMQLAKAFEGYLETGKIPDSPLPKEILKKDRLVEEAKKLGAVEEGK